MERNDDGKPAIVTVTGSGRSPKIRHFASMSGRGTACGVGTASGEVMTATGEAQASVPEIDRCDLAGCLQQWASLE